MLGFATWNGVISFHPVCVPQLQSFSDSLKQCRILNFCGVSANWAHFLYYVNSSRLITCRLLASPVGLPFMLVNA